MKMSPMNWLLVGAAGVGAWWLYKQSQNGNGNGNGNGAAIVPVTPVPVPVPPVPVPPDMAPGEMVDVVRSTPDGMGYAGGIYARHLFAGMT